LKTSKNKAFAWQLLKVLAGSIGQKKLAQTGLALPANRTIADSKYWMMDQEKNNFSLNKSVVNRALKYDNVYNPFLASWPEILSKYIRPEIDKLMNRLITIDEAIKNMHENVNKAIQSKE